ncbi:MAG: hypothetical protein ABIH28_02245 [archaeon]
MEKTDLYGWASNILNALIFIYILLNTTKDCFNKNQLIITAFGLIVSVIVQVYSAIIKQMEE